MENELILFETADKKIKLKEELNAPEILNR